MASLGFTNYDTVEPTPGPTTAELVAALSASQRTAILNGFAAKTLPIRLRKTIFIDPAVITYLYKRIDAIEEYCRTLVRGELVDTPAVIDEDPESPTFGEVIEPATYVPAPTTVTALRSAVSAEFSEEFTASQSDAIVNKMIAFSKADGTGTAAYYLSKVTE